MVPAAPRRPPLTVAFEQVIYLNGTKFQIKGEVDRIVTAIQVENFDFAFLKAKCFD